MNQSIYYNNTAQEVEKNIVEKQVLISTFSLG